MNFTIKISSTFECSLERAFKTPMLCDITKIHTGYGFSPRVTGVTEDNDWGQTNSSKKVFVAKSLLQASGFGFVDRILERNENEGWKIQVDEFQSWTLGFNKFVGEWKTYKHAENKVLVEYIYTLHSKSIILYPLQWIFVSLFWKSYMKRVMENVKTMAYNNEPYQYK